MAPRASENDANNTKMDWPIPNAAYIPRYVPLQRIKT